MILAIRTDSERAELYLVDQSGGIVNKKTWEAGHELSQQSLAEITGLMQKNRKKLEDLTGIIVYKGPGSFTSLRIGISVANTLAYGFQIPIVGTSAEDWVKTGIKKLPKTKAGKYVIPEYGREPHITKPKK